MADEAYLQTSFGNDQTFAGIDHVYHVVNLAGMANGHEAHYHEETVEVCFVKRGILNWWVGDRKFEIHPGDVVVMNPKVVHGSSDSTLQPCEYYALHFYPDRVNPKLRPAMDRLGFGGHHRQSTQVGEIVRQIFDEHANQDELSEETCRHLVSLMIVNLARKAEQSLENPSKGYLISRAQKILESEESGSITVETLATRLKVSTVWLNKVFYSELGQAPGEWLRSRKLNEAKKLLCETSASVTEVAIKLGFGSSQYFATAFRRDTGLTPSEYRNFIRNQSRTDGLAHREQISN